MKPSFTDVASLALLLVFGLVMARGWPPGDWELGWGAIGAIGTIVTGVAAVRISQTQQKWINEERDYRRERMIREVVDAGVELHNLSNLCRYFIESKHPVSAHVMGEIGSGFDVIFALDKALDLHLLNDKLLNAFDNYHGLISAEYEKLGFLAIASRKPLIYDLFIESFSRICDESEKLVIVFGGDSKRLIKY